MARWPRDPSATSRIRLGSIRKTDSRGAPGICTTLTARGWSLKKAFGVKKIKARISATTMSYCQLVRENSQKNSRRMAFFLSVAPGKRGPERCEWPDWRPIRAREPGSNCAGRNAGTGHTWSRACAGAQKILQGRQGELLAAALAEVRGAARVPTDEEEPHDRNRVTMQSTAQRCGPSRLFRLRRQVVELVTVGPLRLAPRLDAEVHVDRTSVRQG